MKYHYYLLLFTLCLPLTKNANNNLRRYQIGRYIDHAYKRSNQTNTLVSSSTGFCYSLGNLLLKEHYMLIINLA